VTHARLYSVFKGCSDVIMRQGGAANGKEGAMTAEKTLPRVGSKLANGATVLAAYTNANGQRYVLADVGAEPYVTWALDNEGNAFSGRYFSDLTEAAQDLAER
jgi:hypothetical protein